MTKLPDTARELDAGGMEMLLLIRNRIEKHLSMAEIAAEIGAELEALLDFCMTYREPRHVARYQGRSQPPIAISSSSHLSHFGSSSDAQRFANWRRSTAGAHKAREAGQG